MGSPFYFGPPGAPLFGWWHAGDPASRRGVPVVICPPVGFDYVGTYRTFRNLALRLADCGFDVLRFDFPGTGDSSGMPTDDGLAHQWLASIGTAVEAAREISGCRTVAVMGARLGATMAAVAARDLPFVESLVVWSPYRSGKAYVREVKALDVLSGANDPVTGAAVSAAGFTLTAETVAALAGFDLLAIDHVPADRLLVIERDDLDSDPKLLERVASWGPAVTADRTAGTGAAFTGPIASKPPIEIMDRIVQWLTMAHPVLGGTVAPTAARPSVVTIAPGCRERPFIVGDGKPLFGLLSEPEGPGPVEEAVVFLNSGADYHIGPHRIFVPLARECAAAGLLAYRFDLQGLGDSATSDSGAENVSYPDHAVADLGRAVAAIRRMTGVRRVLVVGLCSGGWHSIRAARAGLAVDGILAINPPLYFGRDEGKDEVLGHFEVTRYRHALSDRSKLVRLLTGKVSLRKVVRVLLADARRRIGGRLKKWSRRPAPDQTAEDIRWLSKADFPTLVVFSQADLGWFHFDLHLPVAVRRRRGSIDWVVVPHADHTFRPPTAKAKLRDMALEFILEWRKGSVRRDVRATRSSGRVRRARSAA